MLRGSVKVSFPKLRKCSLPLWRKRSWSREALQYKLLCASNTGALDIGAKKKRDSCRLVGRWYSNVGGGVVKSSRAVTQYAVHGRSLRQGRVSFLIVRARYQFMCTSWHQRKGSVQAC